MRLPVKPAVLLLTAAAAWTALVIGAPFVGGTGVYAAAALVCHQLPERSFHFAAGPIAVCARCLGLYAGAVAGLFVPVARMVARPAAVRDERVRVRHPGLIVALAAVPTLTTMAVEWIVRWPVGNVARLVAAIPLGAASGWVVARAIEVDWRT